MVTGAAPHEGHGAAADRHQPFRVHRDVVPASLRPSPDAIDLGAKSLSRTPQSLTWR